ncbi:metallopeptidase [Aerosticca soli]|uniref:Metallopeptidase n=2 Tax=Aerosticca soli TaxID=2010829 RepID=A0A2Z6E422_9GAMM|nr:metallopeptidase [Aerosticca soli]
MMTAPFKPLALAVGLALASGFAPSTASAASTPHATTAHKSFDVSELDPTIPPCQDFNGFVNAKWVAANPIPPDRTRWGAFDQLAEASLNTQHQIVEEAARHAATAPAGSIEQKIGYLYAAGMDEAAIERASYQPIKPQLAQIDALKSPADIAEFIMQRFNEGDGYVFNFGSSADFKNAKMQIGYAFQDGLGLPTRDYYLDPKHKEELEAYRAHIARTLALIGTREADAKRQADAIVAFETELAKASLAPVELRQPENQYHFVSLDEANRITPHFDWKRFFATQGVNIDKGFSLSQPKFFAAFDQQLARAPLATWQAYLRFHTVDSASPLLSKPFQDNHFEFYGKTLAGQPEQKPRWKRVLSTVNGTMGEALGQLYVKTAFKPEAKQRAQTLVDNVRNALKARIQNLDWMSDETKAKALAKWETFLPKIGYPDKWRDWSGLTIKPGDYFDDVQAATKFDYHYDIAKIGKPTDRLEWGMTPQTVNAYYSPTENTINFPAAILQPPFFDAAGDDAINYGGIGAVIGHEATHGFDDQGSQFDGDGNNTNWWTPADRAKFEARAAKLVEQFNEYTPIKSRPDLHVNGKLTLGENIADLGGLNVAYDALQAALKSNPQEAGAHIDGYSQDQRFFLNWARVWRANIREKQLILSLNTDPHAPAPLRAIAAPSNMDAFAHAFQCKPGDPMVRTGDKQVKIW